MPIRNPVTERDEARRRRHAPREDVEHEHRRDGRREQRLDELEIGVERSSPVFAPELARPIRCSAPMFDAKMDEPISHHVALRLARK
jgi:hypothetical protein